MTWHDMTWDPAWRGHCPKRNFWSACHLPALNLLWEIQKPPSMSGMGSRIYRFLPDTALLWRAGVGKRLSRAAGRTHWLDLEDPTVSLPWACVLFQGLLGSIRRFQISQPLGLEDPVLVWRHSKINHGRDPWKCHVPLAHVCQKLSLGSPPGDTFLDVGWHDIKKGTATHIYILYCIVI